MEALPTFADDEPEEAEEEGGAPPRWMHGDDDEDEDGDEEGGVTDDSELSDGEDGPYPWDEAKGLGDRPANPAVEGTCVLVY